MPKLREITILVNNSLKSGNFASRKFQQGRWSDIAYQVSRDENSKRTIRPAIFDLNGEGLDVEPNDTYPIEFYWRITSPLEYPDLSTNNGEGFGNPAHDNKEIVEIALICIGNTSKLKVFREDVCAAICVDIPREFTSTILQGLGLEDCNIEIIETNMDTEDVFNQEFSNVEFNLPPETFMISVKCKITTLFSKNCFELCN